MTERYFFDRRYFYSDGDIYGSTAFRIVKFPNHAKEPPPQPTLEMSTTNEPALKKQRTDTAGTVSVEEDVKGAPVNATVYIVVGKNKYPFNPDNIIYSAKPKKTSYSRKIECLYKLTTANGGVKEVPIILQTPKCVTRFGYSHYQHDSSSKKRYSVDISFPDEDSSFLATMKAWDAKNLEAITKHRRMWFPKRNLSDNKETMGLILGDLVKANLRDDGSTYDPQIRLKINTTEQDGKTVAKCTVFGPNASAGNPELLEAEDIGKNATIRARIVFEAIYLTDEKANPVIRGEQVCDCIFYF